MKLFGIINRVIYKIRLSHLRKQLGYCGKTAIIAIPETCTCPSKIYLEENANVYSGSKFIISEKAVDGKFIMKRNSGSAQNLTVITNSHNRTVGHFFKEYSSQHLDDVDKDVIVEEDVWIGANVTLLAGVTIGRGATVGAGSVCIKSVPPYAIVMGNPAKVVGFNYTPEEVERHELALYAENERLPISLLEKNYEKYFINRIKEIKQFTKL